MRRLICKGDPDWWVTVCSECRTAMCWHGRFHCFRATGAGTMECKASELRLLGREHQDNYSVETLRRICGSVRMVGPGE